MVSPPTRPVGIGVMVGLAEPHAMDVLLAVMVSGTVGDVPVSGIVTVLFPVPFDWITRDAVRVPGYVGVKVTPTVHVAPGASGLGVNGQVLVRAKSPAFVPAMTGTLVNRRFTVPLLVTVTLCAELVVPSAWLPKVRLAGLHQMMGLGVWLPTA